MGIKWSIMTVSWLFGDISNYVSYVINLVDIIQNLCTFIIFVWKKKIKRMLLKRFDCGLFPKAGCETNVTSSTCTTSEASLQEKMSSCKQENHHVKGSSVGTEL
ncbi:g-protein coupled receptor mth2-like protein [Lasius niger]|uniref:G-protein coupled receptor mth2-like protein n=1 Tax=Lasius niger TaxID=67767 RepID=A0A0J7JXN9_LASNI|nr:g-protein coupled receptor mth2-like protein [Lasius niger]